MTVTQHVTTIACISLATILTRALPFLIFPAGKEAPKAVRKLGDTLPPALFAFLVVYCLKGLGFASAADWLPQALSIAAVVLIHLWKRQMLLSILGGTVIHMLLVQLVF